MDSYSAANGAESLEWMAPSTALERFEPPADMVLAAAPEKEHGRYGFKVGDIGFLIQLQAGSEVIQMPAIWSVPGSPPWLLGLINLRGNLVPVYELRQVLGFGQRDEDAKPLVLVFDQGSNAVGLIIEDYPRAMSGLEKLPSLPRLPSALAGHISDGYIREATVWLEFDHASFFEALLHGKAG